MQMSVLYSVNGMERQFSRWAGETFNQNEMAQEIGTLSHT